MDSKCEEEEETGKTCSLHFTASDCPSRVYQRKSFFNPETKPIVWVLGGPGSGKFTQCKKMIDTYGFVRLSIGDLIRCEVKSGSDRAQCLTSIIERGGHVPNYLVLGLLKEAMEAAAAKGARGYLIDGFPYDTSQGIEFERTIGHVALILYFEVALETLVARLITRAEMTGKNENCNLDTIKFRLQTFIKYNEAVIKSYGDRVVKINADQEPDAVFAEVQNVLEPIVEHAQAVETEQAKLIAIEKAKADAMQARSSVIAAAQLDAVEALFASDEAEAAKYKEATDIGKDPDVSDSSSSDSKSETSSSSTLLSHCWEWISSQRDTPGDTPRD